MVESVLANFKPINKALVDKDRQDLILPPAIEELLKQLRPILTTFADICDQVGVSTVPTISTYASYLVKLYSCVVICETDLPRVKTYKTRIQESLNKVSCIEGVNVLQ